MKKVVIMRGLPGSGKSSAVAKMTKCLESFLVVNADSFHMVGDAYMYVPENARRAHADCLRQFLSAMFCSVPLLIVDNKNTTGMQMAPYVKAAECFGYEIEIIEMQCSILEAIQRNVHKVPEEAICRMAMCLSRDLPDGWEEKYTYRRSTLEEEIR